MSLIHDALKKAEYQRQLGEAPTLDSPRFQRRRRARWPWLVLLVVVVLVLAALGYWQSLAAPEAPPAVAATTQKTGPNRAVNAEASPDAGKQAAPAAGSHQPAAAPRQAAPSPEHAHAADDVAAPQRQQAAARRRAAREARAQQQARRQAAAAAAATRAADTVVPAAPADRPQAGKAAAGPTADRDNPARSKPVRSKPAGNKPAPGIPMYWELPYAQRQNIPQIDISMHMYSKTPADRFAVINGQRMSKGDTVADGITVVSIDPDGVTLDLNGQRFRVPRTGMR